MVSVGVLSELAAGKTASVVDKSQSGLGVARVLGRLVRGRHVEKI